MRCHRAVSLALAAATAVPAVVDAQAVRVAPLTEIAREEEPRRFTEPHLAVQPDNSDRLLASGFVITARGTNGEVHTAQHCVTFASRDGGSTWTRHEFPFADCFDAQVALLGDGQAVFVALAEMPGLVPKNNGWLFAFHSADGGSTWDDAPTVVARSNDHPAIAVDPGSAARKGWIYVTTHHEPRDGNARLASRLFVARSRDGGKSFDSAVTIRPNNLHTSAEMPVVLADGTVLASFVDGIYEGPPLASRRAWVVRSTDGATTFSEPLFVNDACGPPPPFQLSALAADTSNGPFRDRLYYACRQRDGGPIVVSHSQDRGDTWNRPPVAAGPRGLDTHARRVVTMAVNNTGVLGVLTVERKPSGAPCLATDFSASLDGGATFTPPARVSSSSCGTSSADEIAGRLTPTYGDYFGLVALADGRFRAVWPEMRDGHSVLLTTTIAVDAK